MLPTICAPAPKALLASPLLDWGFYLPFPWKGPLPLTKSPWDFPVTRSSQCPFCLNQSDTGSAHGSECSRCAFPFHPGPVPRSSDPLLIWLCFSGLIPPTLAPISLSASLWPWLVRLVYKHLLVIWILLE